MLQLTDKINTQELLEQVLSYSSIEEVKETIAYRSGVKRGNVHWWVVREQVRFDTGVYETTEALDRLNKFHKFLFAHISKNDRNMVAFTPDKASGEADRQITTTFGRLASKVMPFVTDDYIRDLTAEHLGDLSNEIEFLEGQGIVDAYAMKTGFPESCMMAGSSTARAWPEGLQPSQAYMMPNIKMAILRDTKNPEEIIARSMVVEINGEKRYIRANYGDPKLERRLIKAGYVKSGWMDVEFNMVPYEPSGGKQEGRHYFLMPYLDAYGGTCQTVGSGLVYMDGKLKGVTQELYENLVKASLNHFVVIPSTRGWIQIQELKKEYYEVTDLVTGKALNRFTDRMKEVVYNGARGFAQIDTAQWLYLKAYDAERGTHTLWYPPGTATFLSGGYTYVDNTETRKMRGWVKLSLELYPESANEWVSHHFVTEWQDATGKTLIAKDEDVVVWIENGVKTFKFKEHLQKSDVKLHQEHKRGAACYVPKGETIYKSVSGRKVHPLYNDIRLRWDGIYDFRRNLANAYAFGEEVYVARKNHDAEAYAKWLQLQLDQKIEAVGPSLASRTLKLFNLCGSGWKRQFYNDRSGTQVANRPETICERGHLSEIADLLKGWKDNYDYDANHMPQRDVVINRLLIEAAEAEATDYNQVSPKEPDEQAKAADSEAATSSVEDTLKNTVEDLFF